MSTLLFLLFSCQDSDKSTPPVGKNTKPETVQPAVEKKPETAPKSSTDSSAMAPLDPKRAIKKAPEEFSVLFETTKGKIVIDVTRAWSPLGADRFYNLVDMGYFSDVAFFRAIKGFMNQFGIHGDPTVALMWRNANIKDEPVIQSNTRGFLSFAKSRRPHSRTTQMFINTKDNVNLDAMGFSPFGKISESKGGGMKVVDQLHTGYGEGAPSGKGPSQGKFQREGNSYLKSDFPELDYILSARVCNNDCE